jgi:sigma-B regulation protein RsbU (phosphoserine phosphatase)
MARLLRMALLIIVLTVVLLPIVSHSGQIALFIIQYHIQILVCAIAILSVALIAQYKQTQVLRENDRLYCELKIKQLYIDRDLTMARTIQQGILNEKIPKISGYEITAFCAPAQKIGGDFYGVRKFGRYVHFYLGDVSGHGISSALLMSLTDGLIHEIAKHETSPAKILTEINQTLCRCLKDTINFITLFYGVLDTRTHTLQYASAGHHPGLLFSSGIRQPRRLSTPKPMLGIFAGNAYAEKKHTLREADRLVLYTDAVIESKDVHGRELGETYFIEAIKKLQAVHGQKLMEQLHVEIKDKAETIQDDLSFMIIERR